MMSYYTVLLQNGIRFSMLPPATNYEETEASVYRWARRGKHVGVHSEGLKPMNDRDRYAASARRNRNRKASEA